MGTCGRCGQRYHASGTEECACDPCQTYCAKDFPRPREDPEPYEPDGDDRYYDDDRYEGHY